MRTPVTALLHSAGNSPALQRWDIPRPSALSPSGDDRTEEIGAGASFVPAGTRAYSARVPSAEALGYSRKPRPKTAAAIIAARPLKDFDAIPGISPKTLDKLREMVCF